MILDGCPPVGRPRAEGIELQLNSLGQPGRAGRHQAELIAISKPSNAELLDEGRPRRLHQSPAHPRQQEPGLQELCAAAPKLIDYLGERRSPISMGAAGARDAGLPSRSTRAWCAAWITTT